VLVAGQSLQQLQRSASIAAFLHDEIEYLAFIVDGSPQIRTLAVDVADHLVEMPPR